MEFFRYTLPNGIRCIFRRVKSPVAYCAMTVNAGSRDESRTEYGMAHFTEHSLFKGTVRRKAYHINNRLEKLGGELNAFTTKEDTVIHATTLRGDLAKAVELISDVLFNSIFPDREIEKEREVVLDEINYLKDSPAERIYDEFEDLLFAGSELGHNILGTKPLVGRFTGSSIKDFMQRCYNTDQMVFSVAADVNEKYFKRIADKYLGGIPARARGFSRIPTAAVAPFTWSFNRGTHQAHCITGGRAYHLHDPHRQTLSLLTNILGGPAANSMLNTLLREKYGLTYNIEASYVPYGDTGTAAIYFGTDKDKTGQCIELIEEVLAKLKTTGLTGRQLSTAKKQFIGQFSIAMESNEGNMLGAAKSCLVYDDIDSPETIYKKIASVTPADIMEVTNEIFDRNSVIIYNGHK